MGGWKEIHEQTWPLIPSLLCFAFLLTKDVCVSKVPSDTNTVRHTHTLEKHADVIKPHLLGLLLKIFHNLAVVYFCSLLSLFLPHSHFLACPTLIQTGLPLMQVPPFPFMCFNPMNSVEEAAPYYTLFPGSTTMTALLGRFSRIPGLGISIFMFSLHSWLIVYLQILWKMSASLLCLQIKWWG